MFYRCDFLWVADDGSSVTMAPGWAANNLFNDVGLVAPELDYEGTDYFFLFTEEGYEYFQEGLEALAAEQTATMEGIVSTLSVQPVASVAGCTVAYEDDFQVAVDFGPLKAAA